MKYTFCLPFNAKGKLLFPDTEKATRFKKPVAIFLNAVLIIGLSCRIF